MAKCRSVVPLADAAGSGLFSDVHTLSSGSVTLRLEGLYHCKDLDRPFYKFDILDATTHTKIGEITFLPEHDHNVVAAIGHSGGELIDAARGRGTYGDALRALSPLAARHGMSDFIIAMPEDNAPAIRAAEKLRFQPLATQSGQARFIVPAR